MPKTWPGIISSKPMTWSSASTPTIIVARCSDIWPSGHWIRPSGHAALGIPVWLSSSRPRFYPQIEIACAAWQFVFHVRRRSSPITACAATCSRANSQRPRASTPDVDYDDELVFLSCILHDLGATDYANGDQRSRSTALTPPRVFCRTTGWTKARVTTVWQAIALHTSVGLAHRFGAEQAIAQMGISDRHRGRRQPPAPRGVRRSGARILAAPRPRLRVGRSHRPSGGGNPLKGPPLTFPGHLHELFYSTPAVTWFDVVAVSGWNDQRRIADGTVSLAIASCCACWKTAGRR